VARARRAQACEACPNSGICAAAPGDEAGGIAQEAERLGHRVRSVRLEEGGARAFLDVDGAAARAEEAYLSELFCCEVQLSSVGRGATPELVRLDRRVLERWERVGFYPTARMEEVGRRMAEACGFSLGE